MLSLARGVLSLFPARGVLSLFPARGFRSLSPFPARKRAVCFWRSSLLEGVIARSSAYASEKYSSCNPLPFALLLVEGSGSGTKTPGFIAQSPSNSHVYPHTSKLQSPSSAFILAFRTSRTWNIVEGVFLQSRSKPKLSRPKEDVSILFTCQASVRTWSRFPTRHLFFFLVFKKITGPGASKKNAVPFALPLSAPRTKRPDLCIVVFQSLLSASFPNLENRAWNAVARISNYQFQVPSRRQPI